MTKLTDYDLKKSKNGKYWKQREGVLSYNKNCQAWIDENGYLAANSFRWWNILDNKKGLYIFNNYGYSSFTSRHQSKIRSLMNELGLDYISVSYREAMQNISLDKILADKIDALYSRENDLALSRATKYAVYTEDAFNELLNDIKAIAKCLKISDEKLDSMLLESEVKANEALIDTLLTEHTRKVERKQLLKENEDLSAIAI